MSAADELGRILESVSTMNEAWAGLKKGHRAVWDRWAEHEVVVLPGGAMRVAGDAKEEMLLLRQEVAAAKAAPMAAAYREGKTLRAIGREHGITGERVRQILVKVGIDKSDRGTARKAREERAEQDRVATVATPIREFLEAEGPVHYFEVLERFPGTTEDEVRRWARAGVLPAGLMLADPQDWAPPGYSDEDLLDAIRSAVGRRGYSKPPISKDEYDRLRLDGDPSGVLISSRLGWRAACAMAGYGVRPERRKYDRVWTDEELLFWIWLFVEHTWATGVSSSFYRYDEWAKTQDGAPCGSQVRIQMKRYRGTGSWPVIVKMAAAEWRGNASPPTGPVGPKDL